MIKNIFLKLTAIIITIAFFLITLADMYIKTYGNISDYPASAEITEAAFQLGKIHPKKSNTLRLMTYNILANAPGFEGTKASERADGVCKILNTVSPDACALQEVSRKWFACIYNNTHYKFIKPVRTCIFEEMTTIIYNPEAVIPIAIGDEAFKSGSSSPLRRMVWAVFLHKQSGKSFALISTHFNLSTKADAYTPVSQALELIALCKTLKNQYKCNVYSLGDYNTKKSTKKAPSPVYDTLCSAMTDTKSISENTSHGNFQGDKSTPYDHIFIYGTAEITEHCTLSQKCFRQLSDHSPIFCDIYIQ